MKSNSIAILISLLLALMVHLFVVCSDGSFTSYLLRMPDGPHKEHVLELYDHGELSKRGWMNIAASDENYVEWPLVELHLYYAIDPYLYSLPTFVVAMMASLLILSRTGKRSTDKSNDEG